MTDKVFSYSPLVAIQNQIRLLYPRHIPQLDASAVADELIVTPDLTLDFELRVVSLNKNTEYTALSYVWGDGLSNASILVNGKRFSVTQNLFVALQHLEYRDIAPAIWIDAICINQKDKAEKTAQVKQMQSIYTGARKVVIWFGPSSGHSDLFAAVLQQFPDRVAAAFGLVNPDLDDLIDRVSRSDAPSAVMNVLSSILHDLHTDGHEWEAVEFLTESADLICRVPWWSRVWVIQEFVLAQDGHYQFGCRRVDAEAVFLLLMIYQVQILPLMYSSSEMALKFITKRKTIPSLDWPMWLAALKERGIKKDFALYYLLCQVYCRYPLVEQDQLLRATDRRDYIYALYALLPTEFRRLGIQIDYRKKWWDLYGQCAYALVCAGYVDVFALCQWTPENREIARWAPTWHRKIIYPNAWFKVGQNGQKVLGYSLFSVSADMKVQCSLMPPEYNQLGHLGLFLKMRGVMVDEVTEVRTVYPRSTAIRQDLREARQAIYGTLFRDIEYLCRRYKQLRHTVYPYSVLQSARWKMLVWDHEVVVEKEDDAVQRATTRIAYTEYTKVLSLFKAVEAYNSATQQYETRSGFISSRLFGALTWVRSKWYAFKSSWHFSTFWNPSTSFISRQIHWLRDVPRWLRAPSPPLPFLEMKEGLPTQTMMFLTYMEGGTPIRPFITASGYIGIGPGDTEPGDKVCILYGGRIPYVVRPRLDFGHGYALQGGAYVHGIMDGEFLNEDRETEDFDLL